jgi:hypothetical protein
MSQQPQQPSTQFVDLEMTRPVWIVSDIRVPAGDSPLDYIYKEEFRGKTVEVPPEGTKKIKMAWLHATKFLAQVAGMYNPFPNGGFKDKDGNVDSSRFGKPLRIVEMTAEERLNAEGLTQEQINERKRLAEAELRSASQESEGAIPASEAAVGPKRRGRRPMNESQAVEEIGITL